jgi:hypothetical protein
MRLPEAHDDVQQNLFQVLCAILNLRTSQRGSAERIDAALLTQYTTQLSFDRQQEAEHLLDQLHVIKSLVNRRTFQLDNKQVMMLHKRFKNLCMYRKEQVYASKRSNSRKAIE